MTIEELPGSGDGHEPGGSLWTTTVLTLGAGVVLGVVVMLAISPPATVAPSPIPAESIGVARASPSRAPSQSATPFPSRSPRRAEANVVATVLAARFRQSLNVDGIPFSFSVPTSGWSRYGDLYISKDVVGSQGAEAMILWTGFPVGLYVWPCDESLVTSNGTAAELAAALERGPPGTELVAATEVTVGGIAATRVVLRTLRTKSCPGFLFNWAGEASRRGSLWGGNQSRDMMTIYVFDAGGMPFIIAALTHWNAGTELEEEAQQIIDSIEFAPGLVDRPAVHFAEGLTPWVRHALTTDDVSFTYSVPTDHWSRYDELYLSADTVDGQAAEAMVLWARYPDGRLAQACDWSGERPDGATAASLAESLSTGVPGTELVQGPVGDSVGGIPAVRVVLSVREHAECGRGYFVTWKFAAGGPFWGGPEPGDTIAIWVLDLGGDPFLIMTETKRIASAALQAETQHIVDSIEFH